MHYDYSELDELLKSKFDADLLADLLFKSMQANIDYGIDCHQNTTQMMQQLTPIRKLAQAIRASKS